MEKNQYLIVSIVKGRLDRYGMAYLVFANAADLFNRLFGMATIDNTRNEDSEVFIFPLDEEVIEPLVGNMDRRTLWEVNLDEFQHDTIACADGLHIAHCHPSLKLNSDSR